MTPGEASFAQHIDNLTHHIHPAYYKSAVIEALYGFTHFCTENRSVVFSNPVVIAHILEDAATLLVQERQASDDSDSLNTTRNLDALLQESPLVLQLYVAKAVAALAKHQDA